MVFRYALLLLLFLLPGIGHGQSQNCYDYNCVIRKVQKALEDEDYQTAFDNLESAAAYPQRDAEEIASLRQQLFDSIQKKKVEAESDRQRAENAERRVRSTLRIVQQEKDRSERLRKEAERDGEANRLTALSLEIQQEDPSLSAKLAHYAYLLSERKNPLAAKIRRDQYQQPNTAFLVRNFIGHHNDVQALAFSPDDQRLLTGGEDYTAKLWDRQGRILQHFIGHQDMISAVAFSPDGRRILTGGQDGEIILWQIDGRELQRMTTHDGAITSLLFSEDGRYMISSSRDKTMCLWDTDGMELMRTPEHSFHIAGIAFGPNAATILTVDIFGGYTIWDPFGQALQYLNMGTGRIFGLAFSPDGRWIMANCEEDRTILWNIEDQNTERIYITPEKQAGETLQFSADSKYIFFLRFNGTVEKWDIWGGKSVYRLGDWNRLWVGTVSSDGRWLLQASEDGSVALWQLDKQPVVPLEGHQAPIYSAAVSPDGQYVVSGDAQGNIIIWTSSGELLQTIQNEAHGEVQALAFRPDGQSFAAGTIGGRVNEWGIDGQWLTTYSFPNEEEGKVWALDYSPDGRQLLVACMRQRAELLQINTNERQSFAGHIFDVRSVAFSPDSSRVAMAGGDGITRQYRMDGQLLAESITDSLSHAITVTYAPDGQQLLTGYYDGLAILWDLEGHPIDTLEGHRLSVWDAAFSPDGEWIATAGLDRTVKLWDRSGALQRTLEGHADPVRVVRFFTDVETGTMRILTAGDDQTIKIWDLSGKELLRMGGHQGSVDAVAFSPSGHQILTGSEDGTIKLWNRNGALVRTIYGHERPVKFVSFSPRDSNLLLSGSLDGTVRLWESNGPLIHTLPAHQYGVKTAVFSPDGNSILSGDGADTLRLWNLNGSLVQTLICPFSLAQASFSSDGQKIAAVGGQGEVMVWSVQGQLLLSASPRMGPLNTVVFAPDNQSLLLGARNGYIYLLDETGTVVMQLAAHAKEVYAALFVPPCPGCDYEAGELIATAGRDGRIKMWDLQGHELQNIKAHASPIRALAIGADGHHLLSGSTDHTARQWPAIACFFAENQELSYTQRQAYGLPFDYEQAKNPGLLIEYANRYLRNSKWLALPELDSARIVLEYLVKKFGPSYQPYLAIPYQQAGNLYLLDGRYPKAIEAYQAALQIDPDAVWVEVKRATAWLYAGDWEATKGIYEHWVGKAWPKRWSANYHTWEQAFFDDLEKMSPALESRDPELVERAKEYLLNRMSGG